MSEFTADQLADFLAFCKVQSSGTFNMLDPRARKAAGLTSGRYLFVLGNYDALRTHWANMEAREEAKQ